MSTQQSSLRDEARYARRQLSETERRAASRSITDGVCTSDYFSSARRVGCYLAMHDEVDTSEIIQRAWQQNLRVFVPVVRKNFKLVFCEYAIETETVVNKLGISEPIDSESVDSRDLDLVITPLVGFDSRRNRIGMGGGYYDREFAYLAEDTDAGKPILIGIAFECQKLEKITPNPWDIRLFRIISESAVY